MHVEVDDDGVRSTNYLDQFRKNWMIIAFIAGLIVTWSNFSNDIDRLNDEVANLKVAHAAMGVLVDSSQQQLANVSGDIREIKVSLSYIKERVGGY